MVITELSLLNFKNYTEAKLEFSPKINAFTGLNGAGKTNLLDAVYYLSSTKSFTQNSDIQCLNQDSDFFMIRGEFLVSERTEQIYCGFKKNQKKIIKRNDKAYSKYSEHIGLIPAVIVSPDDSVLITGHSEERRKFADSVISQFDKTYLDILIKYNRILAQRNALLKSFAKTGNFSADMLEIFNMQLAQSGTEIFKRRTQFTSDLIPVFQQFYRHISGGREQVGLDYKSQTEHADYEELLRKSIEKDRILQYTTVGIHRDDFLFLLDGQPVRKIGSQGQQKTYLIALKFAQFEFLKSKNHIKPILLLDDIFDKFDAERVAKIITLTSGDTFGQIFITDTNANRIGDILSNGTSEYNLFFVENNTVNRTNHSI